MKGDTMTSLASPPGPGETVSRHWPRLVRPLLALFMLLLLLGGCGDDEQGPAPATRTGTDQQTAYQGTIIAMGDSLTAGYGLREDKAYPALLENKLQENGYNWEVINAGVSGETSRGALARTQWIISRGPDIVILETGANDGLRGVATEVIADNISDIVGQFKEADIGVVLAGMQIVRNLGQTYTSDFAGIYPRVADSQEVILVPFFLEGVAGDPDLNQADSIHPNAQGHRQVAANVYPYVVRAIKARQGR